MIYFLFHSESDVRVPRVNIVTKIVALDSPNEINKMYHQHNADKTRSRSPGNFPTITFHDDP